MRRLIVIVAFTSTSQHEVLVCLPSTSAFTSSILTVCGLCLWFFFLNSLKKLSLLYCLHSSILSLLHRVSRFTYHCFSSMFPCERFPVLLICLFGFSVVVHDLLSTGTFTFEKSFLVLLLSFSFFLTVNIDLRFQFCHSFSNLFISIDCFGLLGDFLVPSSFFEVFRVLFILGFSYQRHTSYFSVSVCFFSSNLPYYLPYKISYKFSLRSLY